MLDLINSAINKESNNEFTFFLRGDLNQMSRQKTSLNSNGIKTAQNDVYPCITNEDKKKALSLIWEKKVPGWWHYKEDYLSLSICSDEEFRSAF